MRTSPTEPFTLLAACAFLGWPLESWQYLRGWTHGNQETAFSRNREVGEILAREFTEYVSEQIRVRREDQDHERDDVTSQLMATEVEGRPLNDDENISALSNWIAGHGTVAAALGILVVHLATHTDDQQRLRNEPALLPAAIDEILRTDGPLVANRRTTTRDVEIRGRQISRGERLTLIWIAANRDGRVFDEPDAVQFDRDQRANLLFGAGIHDCLGAPLARLEMRVALEELLARTSAIDLASTRAPARSFYPSNGPVQVPITVR